MPCTALFRSDVRRFFVIESDMGVRVVSSGGELKKNSGVKIEQESENKKMVDEDEMEIGEGEEEMEGEGDDDDPACGISTLRSTVTWCSASGVR